MLHAIGLVRRAPAVKALVVFTTGVLFWACWASTAAIPTDATFAASPAPPAETAAQQGLALTFESLAKNKEPGTPPDTRPARLLALYVPQGAAPSPFTPAGPFRATWEGDLNLKLRERWGFRAEGRGKLTVTIDDKPVLQAEGDDLSKIAGEPVRLKKGANRLKAVYESPAQGDAEVRVFWFQTDLPPEPIPPTVFSYDPAAHGTPVREGRFLLAEFRCTKCHAAPGQVASAPTAMPELAMDAPSLADAGARLNRDWIAAWMHNPRALRPTAHMPRLFGDQPDDTRAADVAAYLATLGASPGATAPATTPAPEQVQAGGRLFAALNCVGCHVPPGAEVRPSEQVQPPRVPLGYVAAKFKPAALKRFLLDPHAHYAWNPMPNFKLSEPEAEGLTAFLLATGTQSITPPPGLDKADPQRGKALFASSGCLNCHAVEGHNNAFQVPPALAQIQKEHWTQGCLAPEPAARKTAPDFTLSPDQRAAITAFATAAGPDYASLGRDNPIEFAERQFEAMRCAACHARDGQESLLATALDAEAKALADKYIGKDALAQTDAGGPPLAPDQRAPMLTWAGDKLRPEWMADFIAGKVPYKPRPYLRARMPAFPARAEGLAHGFAMGHGNPPRSRPAEPAVAEMAEVGHRLIGQVNGFSCVQCHAAGDTPPLAPFEAPAINFSYAQDRLRKPFYHRWMHNPLRIDPTTKMPQFSTDGTTALRDVYEGDAHKQFEAIWQYLQRGKDVKAPQ